MVLNLSLRVPFILLPVVQPILDTPISVSCSKDFHPTNWTRYAFIIQTFIMVIATCIDIYYIYKLYRTTCCSNNRTRFTNLAIPVIHGTSLSYGQVLIPSHNQTIAFYACISPNAPPGSAANSTSSNTQPATVS